MSLAIAGQHDWAIESPDSLAWHSWEGTTVLYDERTGDIHYLDDMTAAIFERTLRQPRSFSDLVTFAADRLQVVPDSEMQEMVNEILMILRDRQIVAPTA